MRRLVRLYPAGWRRRYGAEFETVLAAQEPSVWQVLDVLRGAIDAHLHPGLWRSDATPFTRLGEPGRRVLALAQDEARRLRHDYLGTEHLALALARQPGGVGARVLSALGVDEAALRNEALRILGQPAAMAAGECCTARLLSGGEMRLMPRLKRVLDLAADEAAGLHDANVVDAHLLLGLLRDGEGVGAAMLGTLGVRDLDVVRARVREAVGELPHP